MTGMAEMANMPNITDVVGNPAGLQPDDGYFFGLGAFETIAVLEGMPIFAHAHLERLAGTLEFLGIESNHRALSNLLDEGLQLPGAESGSKALKIAVSQANRIATVRDNSYTQASRNRGFALATSRVARNQTSPLVQHKTFNYADNLMQKRLAQGKGCDEPIFCNTDGNVSEGATTNIFVVRDGRIATPPVGDGLLPGIMRAFVMSALDVEERSIALEEALACDEVFVTNSLMGAMPVRSWDGRSFDDHAMARKVQLEYERARRG